MFITNCKIKYFIVILVINSTIIQMRSDEKPPDFYDDNYVDSVLWDGEYYQITKKEWIYEREEKSHDLLFYE